MPLSLVASRPIDAAPSTDPNAADHLLAFLTDGAPMRPRLDPRDVATFVVDLANAVAGLAGAGFGANKPPAWQGERTRATLVVPSRPEPWELSLLHTGDAVLVTLFQGGAVPEVALHERRVDARVLCARVLEAIDRLGDGDARFAIARSAVASARFEVGAGACEPMLVSVDPTGDVPFVLSAEINLRPGDALQVESQVHRADLASLLFKGKIRLVVGGAQRELSDVFVFLVAEQLVAVTLDALDGWIRGRPSYRRLTVGGAICGVRLTSDGAASLTLGVPRRPSSRLAASDDSRPWTFPAVDLGTLSQGIVAFGRALTRSLVRRDRSQTVNLRLLDFRAKVRELAERLREATRNDSKINDSPESYRAFAQAVPRDGEKASILSTRMRFSARWFAGVPSIDLRSTFLCGDRLVVGQARELSCLDRKTGTVMWQKPVPRALAVMTPLGLARVEPDGKINLLEIDRGETLWTTRLASRVGATTSGAVVSAPGLPKMLLVNEGARHLCALDLAAGEVRWRFVSRRSATFRLRRAGKLVILASGDPALTALDVLTGEVVWRFCDRLRFASHVAVDHDALFAVAGEGAFVSRGATRLHHLDPWSGALRWSVDLPQHAAPVGAPLLADDTVVVVGHDRRGTVLYGLERATGKLAYERVACATAASCLMVNGAIVVNGEGGELVALEAATGQTRYRHVFPVGAEGDRPRRLEPVLRSGALFVPQSEVHVVRPSDGTILGSLHNDLVPDLLRVDERCDVYIAEESGHVAAYSAAPRLSLVTPESR
jgi:outer membrane protein assembly factor BamB